MATEEREIQKLDLITLLEDFAKIAKGHILLGILLVSIGGALFGFREYRSYVPVYTASVSVSVKVANPQYSSVSTYNVATAEQMAKTFPYVLTSGVLQERVKGYLGISYMPSVSVKTTTSGSIITIQVSDRDPKRAWDVLNAVLVYYPEIAEYVVGPTKLVLLHESGVPANPSNSMNLKKAVLTGIICGAAIWTALVLIQAMLVNTVHNEKELKNLINIPCVGQIPHVRRSVKKGGALLYQPLRSHSFGEAMRMLRLRTEKAVTERAWNVLLISSAIPGEGKTTISANLAISMAHKGKRVLLIDCDLRNPSVGTTLDMKHAHSIGEYLEGTLEIDEVIAPAACDNLFVIAGSTTQRTKVKSLHKGRMEALIQDARKKYDMVILDTPPCSLLADASEFASMADCGLMVVRQEYAPREQILDGIQRLSDAKLPLIGCVMNHVQGSAARNTGYGYGYGKSYGYGEKKK